jgi:putative radical SAM enzyme (TIGR03279 family)
MSKITGVDKQSPAYRAGIRVGDELVSIAGQKVRDVLDYMFYSYDEEFDIVVMRDGHLIESYIEKSEGEPLGLDFETYLMDSPRSCSNRCVFCFIDQLPPGMRDTLYFKDDDARLSFLMGNYITLTNLTRSDVDKIVRMHISPINISIHTTNPELRVKMLGNRNAGIALEYLKEFEDAGIIMNGQIVLCPGYNDGDELRRTLRDLEKLHPSMHSVSVVPVGITKYRDNLAKLRAVEKQDALQVISIVDEIGDACKERFGTRIFYCADELYLKAELPIPNADYYEDFPQIENGVGMVAQFKEEFELSLEELEEVESIEPFAIATGELFAPIMCNLIDLLRTKCNNVSYRVYGVKNSHFGEKITVSGLVTGGDLINALKHEALPPRILIPINMLRSGENVFLDDVTVEDVEQALGVKVVPVENRGSDLINTIMMR